MANPWFRFKQFTIHQDRCAMKVTTDACLFGAWAAEHILHKNQEKQETRKQKLLDIGTGSGLLALMLAQQIQQQIDALEIDRDALEQASENIKASPWADRIELFHADARSFEPAIAYDFIISNPPFYEKELKSGDPKKNIAHHGEYLALDELFKKIKQLLAPEGEFYLLLPFKRKSEWELLLDQLDLALLKEILVRPASKHHFSRVMLAGSHKTSGRPIKECGEISVKNETGDYSPEFTRVLKDYYLAF